MEPCRAPPSCDVLTHPDERGPFRGKAEALWLIPLPRAFSPCSLREGGYRILHDQENRSVRPLDCTLTGPNQMTKRHIDR